MRIPALSGRATRAIGPRLALLAATILLGASAADARDRRIHIDSLDVTMEIGEDGAVTVEERYAIRFEGRWNGLERVLRTRAADPSLGARRLRLSSVTATDGDGNPLERYLRNLRDGLRIRVRIPTEDASRTVVLRYEARDVLRRVGEQDRFYWNVTGSEWSTGMARVTAALRLPESILPDSVTAVAYRGGFGSGRIARVEATEGALRVEVEDLAPFEGLTLLADLPPGTIAYPTWSKRIVWLLAPQLPALLPVAFLLAMVATWWFRGRDELDAARIVRTDTPPEEIGPMEAGMLVDYKLDQRDIVAGLVSLACRGAVTIEEHPKNGLVVRRSPDEVVGLPEWDREFLEILFPDESNRELSLRKSRPVKISGGSLRDRVTSRLTSAGLLVERPGNVVRRWTFTVLLVGVVHLAVGLVLGFSVWFHVVTIVCTGAALLLARAMPSCTSEGLRVLAKLKGLEQYVLEADADRVASKPKSHFTQVLPYAIALGVERAWMTAFGEEARHLEPLFEGKKDVEDALVPLHVAAMGFLYSTPRFAGAHRGTGGDYYGAGTGFHGSSFGGGFSGGGFGGGGGGGW